MDRWGRTALRGQPLQAQPGQTFLCEVSRCSHSEGHSEAQSQRKFNSRARLNLRSCSKSHFLGGNCVFTRRPHNIDFVTTFLWIHRPWLGLERWPVRSNQFQLTDSWARAHCNLATSHQSVYFA